MRKMVAHRGGERDSKKRYQVSKGLRTEPLQRQDGAGGGVG